MGSTMFVGHQPGISIDRKPHCTCVVLRHNSDIVSREFVADRKDRSTQNIHAFLGPKPDGAVTQSENRANVRRGQPLLHGETYYWSGSKQIKAAIRCYPYIS